MIINGTRIKTCHQQISQEFDAHVETSNLDHTTPWPLTLSLSLLLFLYPPDAPRTLALKGLTQEKKDDGSH